MEAAGRADVIRNLGREKLQPVSIREAGSAKSAAGKARSSSQPTAAAAKSTGSAGGLALSSARLILFTEELADLLEAGLPLESALKVIESRKESGPLKGVAGATRQGLRDGRSLAVSLRHASPSFGELYCNMIAAGETAGALTKILRRQARFLNTMNDLRKQVIQSLIYPTFVFFTGIALLTMFMTVLVPQLVVLFEKTDKDLPFATRALMGISGFFTGYWWLILGVILALVGGAFAVVSTPAGRTWWDRFSLRIPLIGPVFECKWLAQFAQTLANLVENGLPLLDGIKLLERATGNTHHKTVLTQISELVADGISLKGAMRRIGGFPDLFVDLVAVGEQTGDLPAALERTARRYEKEMNGRIATLTALIQPIIIIVIAIVILALVYAIITSIFQVTSSLRMRSGG